MRGLMQDHPLLVSSVIEFAARYHRTTPIISYFGDGVVHRYTYWDCASRARRMASALGKLGIGESDCIGTLALNSYRHLELHYAISGMGAIFHTVNPRLFEPQIAYIINHAEDRYIFIDPVYVPILERVSPDLTKLEGVIVMCAADAMPESEHLKLTCYETLLETGDDDFVWPILDENLASALCYTSGTTGNPKGVLFSHRSTLLHMMSSCTADCHGLVSRDIAFPVVPLFHANGWGLPYAMPMVGCAIVFADNITDGAGLHDIITAEGVTFSSAVPTVWLGFLDYLEGSGKSVPGLNRVVIGGSAAPRSMIEKFQNVYGVEVRHAWGMTEMSPLGTIGTLKAEMAELSPDERLDFQVKQGRVLFGVDMKIVDEDSCDLPWDGVAFGHLIVRGPWITSGYFKGEGGGVLDKDGWFDTGDIATIDAYGFMQITDRSKDVIKSGGEWISSIDLENAAVGHPEISEAAVIGVAHPRWQERPLLLAVRHEGDTLTKEALLDFLASKVAKWWLPDDILFVDELPHTATGKLLKTRLRELYGDYVLPTVETRESS